MPNLELSEVFHYEDGKLYWKISPKYDIFVGDKAGSLDSNGYTEIQYAGVRYKRHRLVYYLHTGKWPLIVDHIDQNPGNDRFENLRDVPQIVNCANSNKFWGSTPFRGVCWVKGRNKYKAHIRLFGKSKHLGYYDSAEEASKAYQTYKQVHTAHIL